MCNNERKKEIVKSNTNTKCLLKLSNCFLLASALGVVLLGPRLRKDWIALKSQFRRAQLAQLIPWEFRVMEFQLCR